MATTTFLHIIEIAATNTFPAQMHETNTVLLWDSNIFDKSWQMNWIIYLRLLRQLWLVEGPKDHIRFIEKEHLMAKVRR